MILKEFAVDPAVMAELSRCAYVLDQMGFPFGRMISGFPAWKKWKDLVRRACTEAGVLDVARKRIMHRVERAKGKFVPNDRLYKSQLKWIANVRGQYPERPFDAVITLLKEKGIGPCLVVEELSEDHPIWNVARGAVIDRTAAAIAQAAGPLVLHSREIVFVDPYFDPSIPKCRDPLGAVLAQATRSGRVLRRCEFHSKVVTRDRGAPIYSAKEFETLCQTHLPPVLPKELELSLVRWEQKWGGDKPHPRYILTETGGMSFEGGLYEGKPGESIDVAILEPAILERRRCEYQLDAQTFHRAQDPIIVVGQCAD